jgi:hypothetical protein
LSTFQTEIHQPPYKKFCTIDDVSEVIRSANSGWNRLPEGGPADKWKISSITFLTLLHSTLPFYVSANQTAQPIRKHIRLKDAVC